MKLKRNLKHLLFLALITGMTFSCTNKNDSELETIEEEPDPCSEYDPVQQLIIDSIKIETFLSDNQLTDFSISERGLFYKIVEEGEDGEEHPTLSSTVVCDYVGRRIDSIDIIFDAGINAQFGLNQVIEGWQDGIPKLKREGSGIFILPSTLAYGKQELGGGLIRPNEILHFEVTLLDFWD